MLYLCGRNVYWDVMEEELFRNHYRVLSTRAAWHGYNGGMYFVTICTKNREHYLGRIENEEMCLSKIGKYTQMCIQQISTHNPYAEIPLWVVMPNHIHAIVLIGGGKAGDCRDVPWRVSTDGKNTRMQNVANRQGKLSTMIGGLKQSVTRYANGHGIPFSWQPRFYDRIIRNANEMNRIAGYIEQNVAKWECDELYG